MKQALYRRLERLEQRHHLQGLPPFIVLWEAEAIEREGTEKHGPCPVILRVVYEEQGLSRTINEG